MKHLVIPCALSLALLAGCGSEPPEAPGPAAAPAAERPEPEAASFLIEPPVGSWRLVAFGDATEVPEPEVTLQVEVDGKIAGMSGCNRYFGQWTSAEGRAAIGPVGGTRMMCPPEVMEIEDRFLEEIEKTAGWRPHVDGLVLVDAAGDPLFVFQNAS